MNRKYERITLSKEIDACLREFDDCYERIEKRIDDMENFIEKLEAYGIIIRVSDNNVTKGVTCFYANDLKEKCGFISLIWIKKEFRCEGIGGDLLKICLDEMRHLGMEFVKLEVDKKNTKAIAFYQKNDFTVISNASENSYYMLRPI